MRMILIINNNAMVSIPGSRGRAMPRMSRKPSVFVTASVQSGTQQRMDRNGYRSDEQ